MRHLLYTTLIVRHTAVVAKAQGFCVNRLLMSSDMEGMPVIVTSAAAALSRGLHGLLYRCRSCVGFSLVFSTTCQAQPYDRMAQSHTTCWYPDLELISKIWEPGRKASCQQHDFASCATMC